MSTVLYSVATRNTALESDMVVSEYLSLFNKVLNQSSDNLRISQDLYNSSNKYENYIEKLKNYFF